MDNPNRSTSRAIALPNTENESTASCITCEHLAMPNNNRLPTTSRRTSYPATAPRWTPARPPVRPIVSRLSAPMHSTIHRRAPHFKRPIKPIPAFVRQNTSRRTTTHLVSSNHETGRIDRRANLNRGETPRATFHLLSPQTISTRVVSTIQINLQLTGALRRPAPDPTIAAPDTRPIMPFCCQHHHAGTTSPDLPCQPSTQSGDCPLQDARSLARSKRLPGPSQPHSARINRLDNPTRRTPTTSTTSPVTCRPGIAPNRTTERNSTMCHVALDYPSLDAASLANADRTDYPSHAPTEQAVTSSPDYSRLAESIAPMRRHRPSHLRYPRSRRLLTPCCDDPTPATGPLIVCQNRSSQRIATSRPDPFHGVRPTYSDPTVRPTVPSQDFAARDDHSSQFRLRHRINPTDGTCQPGNTQPVSLHVMPTTRICARRAGSRLPGSTEPSLANHVMTSDKTSRVVSMPMTISGRVR